MTTQYFESAQAAAAAALIRKGGLVVFPTETVYGLGANALNPGAVAKIFAAKGRPSDNPLIVHVAEEAQLAQVAAEIPAPARLLMDRFWPGPLSLVLPKTPAVPGVVTAGLNTVGVRWPRDPVAQEFLKAAGVPVAAPSANISGSPSPTTFAMAKAAMAGRVEGLLAGQDAEVGLESTIVGFPEGRPRILRLGGLSAEALAEALSLPLEELLASSVYRSAPPAPGMKYPHYKPEARVIPVDSLGAAQAAAEPGAAWLGLCEPPVGWDGPLYVFRDLDDYAHGLYAAFFDADRRACPSIVVLRPPETGLGRALRQRLEKASQA